MPIEFGGHSLTRRFLGSLGQKPSSVINHHPERARREVASALAHDSVLDEPENRGN
jgi:hypothetical protein